MGKLIYGSSGALIECDDRVLAHLRFVMLMKLRRREAFAFSWDHGLDNGGGRSTVWVHPSCDLRFHFSGGREPSLNRAWIELLTKAANSNRGLLVLPEPDPDNGMSPAELVSHQPAHRHA